MEGAIAVFAGLKLGLCALARAYIAGYGDAIGPIQSHLSQGHFHRNALPSLRRWTLSMMADPESRICSSTFDRSS